LKKSEESFSSKNGDISYSNSGEVMRETEHGRKTGLATVLRFLKVIMKNVLPYNANSLSSIPAYNTVDMKGNVII
jgi:hypothetical protein